MSPECTSQIEAAMNRIPGGLFILTTAHGGQRSGVLARWVQPCATTPPLVMVALRQGLPVEPLIRDNRAFVLCQVSEDDRLLRRLFANPPERGEDPFFALPVRMSDAGNPIIERALSFLECRVMRHVDLDTHFRLFVGEVTNGGMLNGHLNPAIALGPEGTGTMNGRHAGTNAGTNGTPNGTANGTPHGKASKNGAPKRKSK